MWEIYSPWEWVEALGSIERKGLMNMGWECLGVTLLREEPVVTYEVGEIQVQSQVYRGELPWHWGVSKYFIWEDYDFIGVGNEHPLHWSVCRALVWEDIIWASQLLLFVGNMSTVAKSLLRPWEIKDRIMWDWSIKWWDYCRWQWMVPVDILFGYWGEK